MPDEQNQNQPQNLNQLVQTKLGAGQIAPLVLTGAGVIWLARVILTGQGSYAGAIALVVIGAVWCLVSMIDLRLLPDLVMKIGKALAESMGWAWDRLAGIVSGITDFLGNLFTGRLAFDSSAPQNFNAGNASGATVLGGGAAGFNTWLGGLGGDSATPTGQTEQTLPPDNGSNNTGGSDTGSPDWWGGDDGQGTVQDGEEIIDGAGVWIPADDESIAVTDVVGVAPDDAPNPAWGADVEAETDLADWPTRIVLTGSQIFVDGLAMQPIEACEWINKNSNNDTRFLINIENGDRTTVDMVLACLRSSGWVTTADVQ